MLVPLTESLTLIITIPETAVEYGGEFFVPGILLLSVKVPSELQLSPPYSISLQYIRIQDHGHDPQS